VEFIDALPKTPNGKVQRSVLRAAEQDKAAQPGWCVASYAISHDGSDSLK
jgi:acyl-CoA synthetase (AMP-forming)/AMP-acid ligase II